MNLQGVMAVWMITFILALVGLPLVTLIGIYLIHNPPVVLFAIVLASLLAGLEGVSS